MRMDQVSGEVLGRTRQKFEAHRRPGVCKAKGSDENQPLRGSSRMPTKFALTDPPWTPMVPEEVAEGRGLG